jgi:GT2 family glycosyltransferase
LIYLAASGDPDYYRLWIETAEQLRIDAYLEEAADSHTLARNSTRGGWVALIIVKPGHDPDSLENTVRSAQQAGASVVTVADEQEFSIRCEGCIHIPLSRPEAIAALLSKEAQSPWFVPLSAGDLVSPVLGRVLSVAKNRNPDARIFFWDEDCIDQAGLRSRPWLKPKWNDLYFLVRRGLGGSAAYHFENLASLRGPFVADCNTPDWEAELELRLVTANGETALPVHVPLILSHRPSTTSSARSWPDLLDRHWPTSVALSNGSGKDEPAHLRLPEPQVWPTVSIIVPTRDHLDLLRTCMSGIEKLAYKGELEIIIADNESREPETLEFFGEQTARGVRVLPCPGPFNFAAMNNRAAREARGSVLCLLNNDVEMTHVDWLAQMVTHAVQPGAGAVGALLLYPDKSVQHCGVAIGIGGAAGHVYRGIRLDDEGNRFTHICTRRVTAVTAACLVVSRAAFESVGGLDEENFAVAFNDVDFCLKLDAAGFRNVLVAEAQLIHHESKSRGSDLSRINKDRYLAELARLKSRWHTGSFVDPFHSPLLSRESEEFILAL